MAVAFFLSRPLLTDAKVRIPSRELSRALLATTAAAAPAANKRADVAADIDEASAASAGALSGARLSFLKLLPARLASVPRNVSACWSLRRRRSLAINAATLGYLLPVSTFTTARANAHSTTGRSIHTRQCEQMAVWRVALSHRSQRAVLLLF